MVTLPQELLRAVDDTARELKQNRSFLVRQALSSWIAQIRQQKFEELLAEGYRESAQWSTSMVMQGMVAQNAATEGTWRWDDEP